MSTKPLFLSGWQVVGIRKAGEFFSALPEILVLPVNLSFEGTSISSDVQALFASNAVTPSLQIPTGTLWPKPSMFHVHATEQFLRQLATLAQRHAEPEICDHFHAYKGSRGLMQWYDAFSGDPLLVDESITETALEGFCRKLALEYAHWQIPSISRNSQEAG